jgi:hypothetical protein
VTIPWSCERRSRNVIDVRVDMEGETEHWFLLSSDRHHDNVHADWSLELKHLNQARERDAGIIDIGDMHCAMQGKYDRRADRSQLRDEYQMGNYLDRLVEVAAEFYRPFVDNFVVIGRGNHETAIRKYHETDLTDRTCAMLRQLTDKEVHSGGYGGWVRFYFHMTSTRVRRICLKYFHGSGGGGPVTRGVIQTNRMAVFLPDAQIIATGHTHDQWLVPISRERISNAGEIYLDEQVHVRCGTYKDEYHDGSEGWHIERGAPPKPVGAQWLRFFRDGDRVKFDITRAK